MKRKQFRSFLAAVLILTAVGPALHAESIYFEYERRAKTLDPNDPEVVAQVKRLKKYRKPIPTPTPPPQ